MADTDAQLMADGGAQDTDAQLMANRRSADRDAQRSADTDRRSTDRRTTDRDARRAEAAKHCALMKGAFASETAAAIEAAVVYEDGQGRELPLPEAALEATKTSVTSEFPAAALLRASGKAAVVDPASFLRPGGAYEDGAFGPEQALCADSNLYQILCGLRDVYYNKNRGWSSGQLFTDRALYIPNVVFNRTGDIRMSNVIVVAEPIRARALENHRSERECDSCLANRIETMMRIAAVNEIETLVVGAFGCGRQGYEVSQVIALFKAWIEAHPGVIKTLVFAVPRVHLKAFEEAFGTSGSDEAKQDGSNAAAARPQNGSAASSDVQTDDDIDFATIELPEGVTLRS